MIFSPLNTAFIYEVSIHFNSEKLHIKTISDESTGLTFVPFKVPQFHKDHQCFALVTGLQNLKQVFVHKTNITCKAELNHLYVALNRDVYTGDQQILANIHQNFYPNHNKDLEDIEVHLEDPDKFVVKKWFSLKFNQGVSSINYYLPTYPKVGYWSIVTNYFGSIRKKYFKVEKHYLALFEIIVSLPKVVTIASFPLKASVEGAFVTERFAQGDINIVWLFKSNEVKIRFQSSF